MGFKILLIATTGSDKKEDFTGLGVETTQEWSEWEDHGVAVADLKTGSRLFYIMDNIEPNPAIFERMSKNCELKALYIYENMLLSYFTTWKNGAMQSSVLHNYEEGKEHLLVEGPTPETLEALIAKKKEAQAKENDVDHFFDIPGDLFASVTGYQYNFSYEFDTEKPWEVLKRKLP